MTRRPPSSPLFPYTTLFRSRRLTLGGARPLERSSSAIGRHSQDDRQRYSRNRFHFWIDRKSTRLNSSHLGISYAVFCLKKKKSLGRVIRSKVRMMLNACVKT